MNAKLGWFNALEQMLHPEDRRKEGTSDYEFYQEIQPQKDLLWDMLYDLNNQLVEIQNIIGELEF
jgi:hypothetical protein